MLENYKIHTNFLFDKIPFPSYKFHDIQSTLNRDCEAKLPVIILYRFLQPLR